MRTKNRILRICMLSVVLLMSDGLHAHAATRTWQGATYGTGTYADAFSNAIYWGTLPGAGDLAYFVGTGTQPLDGKQLNLALDGNIVHDQIRVRYGSFTVAIDLAGYTYTANSTATDGTFFEGDGPGNTLTLLNSGGAVRTASFGYFAVGRNASSVGFLNLTGPNLFMTTATLSYVGTSGTGTMHVTDGAQFESNTSMTLGHGGTGNGTLLVSGNGSEFRVGTTGSAHFNVGNSGSGSLTVENQGYLYVRSNLRLGLGATGWGTGLVTGSNSRADASVLNLTRGNLTIADGGHLDTRATGTASTVGDGSTLRMDNGTAAFTSHLTLNAGSTTQFVIKEERATPFITLGASGNLNIADGAALLAFELDANPDLGLGDFIPLISYGGSRNGLFSGFSEGQTFTLGLYDFEFTYGDAEKTLGLTVIPEPATMGLLLSAGTLLALSTRRRRAGSR